MGWCVSDDEAGGSSIDVVGRRAVEWGSQPSREERVARREQEVRDRGLRRLVRRSACSEDRMYGVGRPDTGARRAGEPHVDMGRDGLGHRRMRRRTCRPAAQPLVCFCSSMATVRRSPCCHSNAMRDSERPRWFAPLSRGTALSYKSGVGGCRTLGDR